MAIAEQFAGLQMDHLIGAPLRAAADASTQLANSTAEFINRVGFDAEGKLRTVAFGYQKRSVNEDGTSNLDEMQVAVPMLSIVPIPNLQIDEVNILFDMEVKQSEREESSMDMGANISGSANFGIVKVSVTGSISAHQSNTRSSDNSAKYHVDVRATNHGTPEGLARVLDIMAANVAPVLIGSSIKDGNGQELSEQARIRAERLKAIRQETLQLENRLRVSENGLANSIRQLREWANNQLNVYQSAFSVAEDNAGEDPERTEVLRRQMDAVRQSWDNFKNHTGDMIKALAFNEEGGNIEGKVSKSFALKSFKEDGVREYESGEYYEQIAQAQSIAIKEQQDIDALEKELLQKNAEYQNAMAARK